jgi:hypothetical protein
MTHLNSKFIEDIQRIISKNSVDIDMGTPDYILAEYIVNTLKQLKRVKTLENKHYYKVD